MPLRLREALKAVGLDFVCISSGGISADTRPTLVANMNVEFAEKVKREVGIATRTVGLIATRQAGRSHHRGRQSRHGRACPRHAR